MNNSLPLTLLILSAACGLLSGIARNVRQRSLILALVVCSPMAPLPLQARNIARETQPSQQASGDSASLIIGRSLERYNAMVFYSEVVMRVVRPNWENELHFSLWLAGDDYALVLITNPARERGQSFLKRHNDLWHWIPSVDKTMRMSGALLSQSWMGSDFSLNDVIQNRSMANDYQARLLRQEALNGTPCYLIELTPHADAPVVWGRVVTWISVAHYDQLRADFYDEKGKLVQQMEASGFSDYNGRRMPSRIQMTPLERPGHATIMRFDRYDFNRVLGDDFFSLQQMKGVR